MLKCLHAEIIDGKVVPRTVMGLGVIGYSMGSWPVSGRGFCCSSNGLSSMAQTAFMASPTVEKIGLSGL